MLYYICIYESLCNIHPGDKASAFLWYHIIFLSISCYYCDSSWPWHFPFRHVFVAIEFSERLSYFGLAASLIIYLTRVIHQDLKTAAKNVNYWAGVTTLMPLFGGFLADAYLGRYSTVLASAVIYLTVKHASFSLRSAETSWNIDQLI